MPQIESIDNIRDSMTNID
jgi:hypothetical protein